MAQVAETVKKKKYSRPSRNMATMIFTLTKVDIRPAVAGDDMPHGITYQDAHRAIGQMQNGEDPTILRGQREIPLAEFRGVEVREKFEDFLATPSRNKIRNKDAQKVLFNRACSAGDAAVDAIAEDAPASDYTATVDVQVDGRNAFGRYLKAEEMLDDNGDFIVAMDDFGASLAWANAYASVLRGEGIEAEIRARHIALIPVAVEVED